MTLSSYSGIERRRTIKQHFERFGASFTEGLCHVMKLLRNISMVTQKKEILFISSLLGKNLSKLFNHYVLRKSFLKVQ